MPVAYRAFWLPKQDSRSSDYQDAFWPFGSDSSRTVWGSRFVLSDGATEGAFSRLWARLLALTFCNFSLDVTAHDGQSLSAFQNKTLELAQTWERRVISPSLPWYALEKASRGAFATLAILTLVDSPGDWGRGRWHSLAIGDTCLAHVRDGQICRWFPLESPDSFGNRPLLLSSREDANRLVWAEWQSLWSEGEWQIGDRFLMMTDALAHWSLTQQQSGDPWPALQAATESAETFADWVNAERNKGALRDDDVTLLVISMEPDRELPSAI